MSCNTGRLTKKKIILPSLLVAAVTVGIYFVFSTTNNLAIAVAVPALAVFAICPAMCAIMGGLIWMMNRSSKNKGKDQRHLLNDEESSSCCSDNSLGQTADYKIQQQESTTNSKLLSKSNNGGITDVTDDIALLYLMIWENVNRLLRIDDQFLDGSKFITNFQRLSFCF